MPLFTSTKTSCALASLLLVIAIGCGGHSPAAPSNTAGGQTSGSGTAVIAGTVASVSGTASVSSRTASVGAIPQAVPPGLMVGVMGTALVSSVDAAGAFQISGVPPGQVRLQFTSNLVNATTDLANVQPDQFVQIQVQVTSASAVVVGDERSTKVSLCHAEGNGTYHLIDVSQSAEGAHRAHGDAKVGEPVPGQSGKTFDSNCQPSGPSVQIKKSTNGEDADSAPGPQVPVGSAVTWQYIVTNTGTLALSGIAVVDDRGVVVNCNGLSTLALGAQMTCTGAGVAVLGQYSNLGTVTAHWTQGATSGTVTDSDSSHYLGVIPEQGGSQKVTLCHRTGAGFYVQIDVDVSAEPAHRAHGDGKIGESVPGQAGKTFGPGCTVQ